MYNVSIKTITLNLNSHFPQVFWDGDGDLVERVSRGRAVGVDRSDALRCDNLIVCGVTCRIFDYIKLKTAQQLQILNSMDRIIRYLQSWTVTDNPYKGSE